VNSLELARRDFAFGLGIYYTWSILSNEQAAGDNVREVHAVEYVGRSCATMYRLSDSNREYSLLTAVKDRDLVSWKGRGNGRVGRGSLLRARLRLDPFPGAPAARHAKH
jgi:hypothetical protein